MTTSLPDVYLHILDAPSGESTTRASARARQAVAGTPERPALVVVPTLAFPRYASTTLEAGLVLLEVYHEEGWTQAALIHAGLAELGYTRPRLATPAASACKTFRARHYWGATDVPPAASRATPEVLVLYASAAARARDGARRLSGLRGPHTSFAPADEPHSCTYELAMFEAVLLDESLASAAALSPSYRAAVRAFGGLKVYGGDRAVDSPLLAELRLHHSRRDGARAWIDDQLGPGCQPLPLLRAVIGVVDDGELVSFDSPFALLPLGEPWPVRAPSADQPPRPAFDTYSWKTAVTIGVKSFTKVASDRLAPVAGTEPAELERRIGEGLKQARRKVRRGLVKLGLR